MPDDADWDPADIRYNTIRWLFLPVSAYAVGPSRANPFTGELYDADIRLSNDYVRFYFDDFQNFINPLFEQNINNIDLKQFVHNGLVDLIVHEVGHTLGLRHNFKASTIFTDNITF